jgi:hypothetical protein
MFRKRIQVPRDFNLGWVRKTSLNYKLTDETYYIFEYVYNLLIFLFFLIIFMFYFNEYYFGDVPLESKGWFSVAGIRTSIKLQTYFSLMTPGVVIALNFLFFFINKKKLLQIDLILRNTSVGEEKDTLCLLRSYYRLAIFLNVLFFFLGLADYVSPIHFSYFILKKILN